MNKDNIKFNQNNIDYTTHQKEAFVKNQSINLNIKKSIWLKIGLIVSIINALFCLIANIFFTYSVFSEVFSAEAGSASGWFLFVAPIMVMIYIFACIPDYLCVLFYALMYNNNNKKKFLILIIVFSFIGYIIMNSPLLDELLMGSILSYIYKVLKIIIIIYNIMLLFIINKKIKN